MAASTASSRRGVRKAGGSPEATRRAFNKRFLLDLAEDWRQHGARCSSEFGAIAGAYLKVCAMLVPGDQGRAQRDVKAISDEEIEQAIEAIQASRGQADEARRSLKARRGLPRSRLNEAQSIEVGLSQSASAGRTDW